MKLTQTLQALIRPTVMLKVDLEDIFAAGRELS
jgi:hypothetical protein